MNSSTSLLSFPDGKGLFYMADTFLFFLPLIFNYVRKISQPMESFFFQCIFAYYFYFYTNCVGSEVKTKISQAVFVGSNRCRAKRVYDLTYVCQKLQRFT